MQLMKTTWTKRTFVLVSFRTRCCRPPMFCCTSTCRCQTHSMTKAHAIGRGTHVPVGEDQHQHIELMRQIAQSFNSSYSKKKPLFPLPQVITRVYFPLYYIQTVRLTTNIALNSTPNKAHPFPPRPIHENVKIGTFSRLPHPAHGYTHYHL